MKRVAEIKRKNGMMKRVVERKRKNAAVIAKISSSFLVKLSRRELRCKLNNIRFQSIILISDTDNLSMNIVKEWACLLLKVTSLGMLQPQSLLCRTEVIRKDSQIEI